MAQVHQFSRKGSSVLDEHHVCSLASDYQSVDWTMEQHHSTLPASFYKGALGPNELMYGFRNLVNTCVTGEDQQNDVSANEPSAPVINDF